MSFGTLGRRAYNRRMEAFALVRVKSSPQQPGNLETGHLETLGSRCLNASRVGDYGKWPGAQGALLDAQGWTVVAEERQRSCPGAPAGHPRCGASSPSNSCRL